jgi:hypothetical protein
MTTSVRVWIHGEERPQDPSFELHSLSSRDVDVQDVVNLAMRSVKQVYNKDPFVSKRVFVQVGDRLFDLVIEARPVVEFVTMSFESLKMEVK